MLLLSSPGCGVNLVDVLSELWVIVSVVGCVLGEFPRHLCKFIDLGVVSRCSSSRQISCRGTADYA